MPFEPYMMDRRDLLRFNADLDNPDFQAKYNHVRKVFTGSNVRPGGLSQDILLLLAQEFQKPEPAVEEAKPEENSEVVVPEKKGPGRPRKELQTA